MIKTILETGQLGYILFFSVYGIDAVITIFIRLKIKKTFSSHIVHIYISICEMVGPMFWFHLFMPIQLLVNGLVVYMETKGDLSYFFIIGTLFILTLLYFLIRRLVFVK
jgi:hypothetical protein